MHEMTLRDYFAGLAMHGIITGKDYAVFNSICAITRHAYEMADYMLAERNRVGQTQTEDK